MKLFSKALILGTSLFLFSCSSDSGSSSSNCESDITFFQTGKYLDYNIAQFGFASGTMRLDFGSCNGSGIYSVNRKFLDVNGVQTSAQVDKMKIEGDFLQIDVQNTEDFYERLYKKNPQLGDSWDDIKTDGTVYHHEVIDLDSLITVPAGTFHCVVYKGTSSTAINDRFLFWNDAIGQIKEDSGFITLELREHN